MPVQLPIRIRELLGNEAEELVQALRGSPPTSIRLNPHKTNALPGTPVPWCATGRYLESRPRFTLDPLYHGGTYYVQEASSMLVEQAVKACGALPEQAVVVDLCAAPGGKTTHLAALLPSDALLIANEVVPARRNALAENIWKWGRPGVVLAGLNAQELAATGAFAHLVLVDAPCSGEGMFRKDPFARKQWSEGLVRSCAIRQRGLLQAAWDMLLPGGSMIYSTCTWEPQENEEQLMPLIAQGAIHLPIPVKEQWGMVQATVGLRCYPHRVRGEGLFIAVLTKPGTGKVRCPHRPEGLPAVWPTELQGWLKEQDQWAPVQWGPVLHALPRNHLRLMNILLPSGRISAPGTPVARQKGATWAPHPALALCTQVNTQAFPVVELDENGIIRYLKGEALPARPASGFAMVQHRQLPLGWVKGAGNRWNDHWPVHWRIKDR